MDKELQLRNEEEQQAINLLKARLEAEWILKKLPNLKIHSIWNWVLCTEREDNIKVFYKYENWKIQPLFNLRSLRDDSNFKQAQIESNYMEIKGGNWVYDLYRINDLKTENWKLIPNLWDKVDRHDIEYYNAWVNIAFSEDRLAIKQIRDTLETPNIIRNWKKYTNEKWHYYVDERLLPVFIKSKSIRLKDLASFRNNWQITDEVFQKYLPQVRNLLLEQISDKRFDKVNDSVNADEIKMYHQNNLINDDLYLICCEKLKELWKIDEKILQELKSFIKKDLEHLKRSISK